MSRMCTNLFSFLFLGLIVFVAASQVNAQPVEKLIKKLSDGRELYQRKQEVITLAEDTVAKAIYPDTDSTKKPHANLKIEAVLKHPGIKQDEIIWSKEIYFPVDSRAFNKLYISDVYANNSELYVLYFAGLDMNVVKIAKNFDGWHSENDTYLESTSESIYPIIESKFDYKRPQIIAKRYIDGISSTIYKWKLKKGKWALVSQKTVKIKLPWRVS